MPEIEVLEAEESPSLDGVGAAIRKLVARMEGVAFQYRVRRTRVSLPDFTPERIVDYWWVHAGLRAEMGFTACWEEGVTPKGGRSFLFKGARCRDAKGVEVPFAAPEYEGPRLSREKFETDRSFNDRLRARADLAAQARERYNTGGGYTAHRLDFDSFKEFESWLSRYLP